MPYEIAVLLAILAMAFLVGTFIILFPISRRLGKAIEEWIKLRHESTPERDLLARIEVELHELRNQVEGLDQRMDFLAERQEFTESLIDQRRRTALPPDSETSAPAAKALSPPATTTALTFESSRSAAKVAPISPSSLVLSALRGGLARRTTTTPWSCRSVARSSAMSRG